MFKKYIYCNNIHTKKGDKYEKTPDFNIYEHIPNIFFNFITGNNKIFYPKIIMRIFLKAKTNEEE